MSDSPRWHLDGLPGTTGIVEVMLYAGHLPPSQQPNSVATGAVWTSTTTTGSRLPSITDASTSSSG